MALPPHFAGVRVYRDGNPSKVDGWRRGAAVVTRTIRSASSAVKRSALVALALPLLGCGSVAELLGVIFTDAGSSAVAGEDGGAPETGVIVEGGADVLASGEGGSFDADGGLSDVDADAALDAGFLMTPFGTPTLVTALADIDADNEDPSMTGDSLELYFMSNRNGTGDIWVSLRSSPDAGWGAPQPVMELNTDGGVSLDGLTMWFSRSGAIWVTTRGARGQPWSPPSPVSELNKVGSQLDPAVDESSLLMFFASNRADAGYDLYSSSRPNTMATWGDPAPITGVNSASDDLDPFVGSYGLQVWFASSRSGAGDLFWSYRGSTTDAFVAPIPLDSLNTATKESDPTLSADFRYILFASNRIGMPQIYEAYR